MNSSTVVGTIDVDNSSRFEEVKESVKKDVDSSDVDLAVDDTVTSVVAVLLKFFVLSAVILFSVVSLVSVLVSISVNVYDLVVLEFIVSRSFALAGEVVRELLVVTT